MFFRVAAAFFTVALASIGLLLVAEYAPSHLQSVAGNFLLWEDEGQRTLATDDNPRVLRLLGGMIWTITETSFDIAVGNVSLSSIVDSGGTTLEEMFAAVYFFEPLSPTIGMVLDFSDDFAMTAVGNARTLALLDVHGGPQQIDNPTAIMITGAGVVVASESAPQPLHRGVWDAETNEPTAVDGPCVDGLVYLVEHAGNTTLGGYSDWKVGDSVACVGGTWAPIIASGGANGTMFFPVAGQLFMSGSALGLAAHGSAGTTEFPIVTTDAFGRVEVAQGIGVRMVNGMHGNVSLVGANGIDVTGSTIGKAAVGSPGTYPFVSNLTLDAFGTVVSATAFDLDAALAAVNTSATFPLVKTGTTMSVDGLTGGFDMVVNGTWLDGVLQSGYNFDVYSYVAAQIAQLNVSDDFTFANGTLALTDIAIAGDYTLLAGVVSATGRLEPTNVNVSAPLTLAADVLGVSGATATYPFLGDAVFSHGVLQSATAVNLTAVVAAQIASEAYVFSADFAVAGQNVALANSAAAGTYALMSGTVGATGRVTAAAGVSVATPLHLASNVLSVSIAAPLVNTAGILGVTVTAPLATSGGSLQVNTAAPIVVSGGNLALNISAPLTVTSGQLGLSFGSPVAVAASNSAGVATTVARSDHVHSHGTQTDATMHAAATGSLNGFMLAVDKTKLDAAAAIQTASTLALRDGTGASGFSSVILDSGRASVTSAAQGGARVFSIPAVASDTFCLLAATQALSGKTLTSSTINDASNTVAANLLRTATGTVDIGGAAAPAAGNVLVATSGTAAAWASVPGSLPVYNAGTLVTAPRIWYQTVTTTTASATFFVTTNGLVGGAAFCSNLATAFLQTTAQFDTAVIIDMPLTSVRSITGNTLVVGVFTGGGVFLGGQTLFANTNTVKVHLQVICS